MDIACVINMGIVAKVEYMLAAVIEKNNIKKT